MSRPADSFQGYPRADGAFGVRNRTLILSITGLSGPAARRAGAILPGALVVCMPYGSGILGDDQALHHRSLEAMATHPNVGAAVVIGGHPPKVARIAGAVAASGRPVAAITMDDCGNDTLLLTDRVARAAAAMMRDLSRVPRETAPLSALFLANECGRSDPSSGLVSNPLVGRVVDRLVDAGGRALFAESIEWLGAEHLVADRAATPAVKAAILETVARREQMAVAAGIDLTGNNPGPTNIAHGLSSIEEKSLGNIAKSGSRPIQGVLGMAEPPPGPGLYAQDAPAYAPESLTGMVLSGAQIATFTTGAGNSFVNSLAPTVKISANPDTAARLPEQVDVDASAAFRGAMDMDTAADALLAEILAVASGGLTWGEVLGEGEEVVSRLGPAL